MEQDVQQGKMASKKRRIVAITMVKNEMDIIESFVRHTLGFADLLIVADHKSTDRTREILEALQEEGLPIVIQEVQKARYAQSEVMTQLMQEAADAFCADIILPFDADEFLVPTGTSSVREILNNMVIDCARSLRWRKYIPGNEAGTSMDTFLLASLVRRDVNVLPMKKVIVSGAFVRAHHPTMAQGNHYLICSSGSKTWAEEGMFCEGIELAHFAWRSPAQACSKFAVGWMNIVAQFSKNTMCGGSYRMRFHEILNNQLQQTRGCSSQWEQCDLNGRIPMPQLRYSMNTMPNVLENVMLAGEAIAEELAETRAMLNRPVVTTIVPYPGGGGDILIF